MAAQATQEYLASIEAWQDEMQVSNVQPPIYLDLLSEDWLELLPESFRPDFIFNMNVAHIVCFEGVVNLVQGAGRLLNSGGRLFFTVRGHFEVSHWSRVNARFHESLKLNIPARASANLKVMDIASEAGFELGELVRMPANNCAFYLNRI